MPALGNGPFGAGAKLPMRTAHALARMRRLEEAKAFLRQHLAGGPQPAKGLLQDATAAGIAERTLHRAKDVLGVQAQRRGWGEGGQWVWVPPLRQDRPLTLTSDMAIEVGATPAP